MCGRGVCPYCHYGGGICLEGFCLGDFVQRAYCPTFPMSSRKNCHTFPHGGMICKCYYIYYWTIVDMILISSLLAGILVCWVIMLHCRDLMLLAAQAVIMSAENKVQLMHMCQAGNTTFPLVLFFCFLD